MFYTETLYSGIDPSAQAATNQTAYKWGFASNKSKVDNEALRAARESVGAATYGRDAPHASSSSSGRVLGPTLPTSSDLTLSHEAASEYEATDRSYKRKRDRLEAKERVEDMVGPKEVGREGMLEKKRARREGDRAFRDKGDDGFVEADEKTLLGGGDSFRERYFVFSRLLRGYMGLMKYLGSLNGTLLGNVLKKRETQGRKTRLPRREKGPTR